MWTKIIVLIGILSTILTGCQSNNREASLQQDSVRYNRQETVDAQSQLATFDPSRLDNQSTTQKQRIIWEDTTIRDKAGHSKKAEDEK